jgi:hypothetical protein
MPRSSSSRKARLAAALIVICLIALTSIIVYEASFLGWPFASGKINGIFGHGLATHVIPPNGTLSVQVSSIQTVSNQNISSPVKDAYVQVYPGGTTFGTPAVSNYTGSDGIITLQLIAAQYTVKVTNTLSNSTTPTTLNVQENLTTVLTVDLNVATYQASFFDIVNPANTTILPTWSPIYLQIHSLSVLPVAVDTPYLSLTYTIPPIIPRSFSQGTPFLANQIPILVSNQIVSAGTGTLLMQVNLRTPTDVANVETMSVSTVGSTSNWYYYNVTSGQTISATTT